MHTLSPVPWIGNQIATNAAIVEVRCDSVWNAQQYVTGSCILYKPKFLSVFQGSSISRWWAHELLWSRWWWHDSCSKSRLWIKLFWSFLYFFIITFIGHPSYPRVILGSWWSCIIGTLTEAVILLLILPDTKGSFFNAVVEKQ